MSRDYTEVGARIRAVCAGEDDAIALMATVACELHHAFDDVDWVGFYRVVAPGLLKIGPYQGGHGCLVIPFERGVCGARRASAGPRWSRTWTPFPDISLAPPRPVPRSWCRSSAGTGR